MNIDGSEQERFIDLYSSDRTYCFSADWSKIAIVMDRGIEDPDNEISIFDVDDCNRFDFRFNDVYLTNNDAEDTSPSFSPLSY
jgi:hypothetical protein